MCRFMLALPTTPASRSVELTPSSRRADSEARPLMVPAGGGVITGEGAGGGTGPASDGFIWAAAVEAGPRLASAVVRVGSGLGGELGSDLSSGGAKAVDSRGVLSREPGPS